jgi:Trk-type K+ transport system membrane component
VVGRDSVLWRRDGPDRRDVRVDVGADDDRRDGHARLLASTAAGLFFWRSLTQWLGGMGVIALFVAVLPRLAIGGRQLFFAEAPGPTDEKLTPQIRKTAARSGRSTPG